VKNKLGPTASYTLLCPTGNFPSLVYVQLVPVIASSRITPR